MKISLSSLASFINSMPKRAFAQTEKGMLALQGTDTLCGEDIRVQLKKSAQGLKIAIQAGESTLCRVTLEWAVDLPADTRVLCDHWERGYGDLGFRGLSYERVLPWYFIAAGDKRVGVGVKTGASAFCSFTLTRDTLRLCIDVRNGAMGVRLNGRNLEAAEVVVMQSAGEESSFAFTHAFCKQLCDNPLMPDAPVYGGNNWYYAYGESSQEKILEDSRFIADLAPATKNRPYMFIDDGWQICRNTDFCGGPWHVSNHKFPDMPRLAEDMKKLGLRPGLWIRPLLNARNFPAEWRLPPERFLKRELGGEFGCFLDPSIPEALEWIAADIALLRAWGFEAIKHDYTTYDILGRWGMDMGTDMTCPGWHFSDRTRTTMEIILALYRGISTAAGEALVLGCNTISHAAAGLFQMQRTGDDTSGVDWARTRKMGVNTLAFRAAQHGAFYAADADCVGITDEIPWELNSEWLNLVAKSGTPLLVSIDPKTATAEHVKALKKAFAEASEEQPLLEPLDWMDTDFPTEYNLCHVKTRFKWEL